MPSAQNENATGKVVIVTGGSRGLGRNTAVNLARRGVDVIFTYHSKQSEAESLVREIESMGRKAAAFRLDTGDLRPFDGFVADVRNTLQSWGRERFDYLVNNAGNSQHINFDKVTEADFDAVVNVHFKGVYFLTQKLLPLLKDGGQGRSRGVDPISGQRAWAAPDHRECGRAGGHPDGLQRGHGAGQSRDQQTDLGDDSLGASGSAGRHRTDDRRPSLRRESLGERPENRSLRRAGTLGFAWKL